MYKNLLLICAVLLTNGLFAQNYQLTEKSIIASGMDRIWTGETNIHLDSNGDLNVFYLVQHTDTDFVYHVVSTDMGSTWGAAQQISYYKHISSNAYRINYVNSTMDNAGKWHLIFNYRGNPLYTASTSYPPEHIAYVSNESGSWQTFMNVMDDSLALMTSGQSNSTSYCYGSSIISQNGTEFLSAFDYAWFATKSHVIHAKRTTGGNFDSRGEAIVTYDRGAIDKYSLRAGRIIGDGNSFYTIWFNRNTGELNIKDKTTNGWGATQTIHSVTDPVDGVLNYYNIAAPQGNNGNLKAFFTRWEDDANVQPELFVIDKVGSTWSVYKTAVNEKQIQSRACVKNNTLFGFYLTINYDTIRMIEHNTANGFLPIANIIPPNSDKIYNINLLPNSFDPILYIRLDANNQYTLAVGTLSGNVGTSDISKNVQPINIYPNPTNNQLNIHYLNNQRIRVVQIFNMSGVKIKEVQLNNRHAVIDVNDLTAGLYFTHIIDSEGNRTIDKFIKK